MSLAGCEQQFPSTAGAGWQDLISLVAVLHHVNPSRHAGAGSPGWSYPCEWPSLCLLSATIDLVRQHCRRRNRLPASSGASSPPPAKSRSDYP